MDVKLESAVEVELASTAEPELAPAVEVEVYTEPMSVPDHCDLEDIGNRVLGSLDDATYVNDVFLSCQTYFQNQLSSFVTPKPSDDMVRATFATLTAYASRPYGGSTALYVDDLMASDVLDCDNYNVLAGHIYSAIGGTAPWRFVGFYGGELGSHSIGILEEGPGLILDPTIGVIAKGDFNALVSGQQVTHLMSRPVRDDIDYYHDRVVAALKAGSTQPSDLLYWFPSIEAYINNSISSNWVITPGSQDLRDDLEASKP